jgi:hypothetical protein
MALSLEEAGGMITGSAWQADLRPIHLAVTGSRTGNTVSLRLFDDQVDLALEGTYTGDTLDLSTVPGAPGLGFAAVLPRLDTIPTGRAMISARGATTADATGYAFFIYGFANLDPMLIIDVDPPFASRIFIQWSLRDRPIVGSHSVTSADIVRAELIVDPERSDQTNNPFVGGTIRLDHSNRITLAGQLDLQARLPSGQTVSVTGTFSAGCVDQYC